MRSIAYEPHRPHTKTCNICAKCRIRAPHRGRGAVLPGARSLLRRIGDSVDTVTYLGECTRLRLARALSPAASAQMTRLAPGVDSEAFRPGAGGAAVRERFGLAGRWIYRNAADASYHGVSEAVYLADPDGNGIELYRDRPREEWPLNADGSIQMAMAEPLDLEALLKE